jgi:hypothetical protein
MAEEVDHFMAPGKWKRESKRSRSLLGKTQLTKKAGEKSLTSKSKV